MISSIGWDLPRVTDKLRYGPKVTFEKYLRIVDNLLDRPWAITDNRYEYVKDKNEVFRYDNFARHPGIRAPYHHKHISKRRAVQLEEAPKFIDVIEEAVRYMF